MPLFCFPFTLFKLRIAVGVLNTLSTLLHIDRIGLRSCVFLLILFATRRPGIAIAVPNS